MKTHVTFVLDSSGSMASIEDDTKGGFNVFLLEQREEAGEATVTLYNFDTTVDLVYRGLPVEEAPKLDSENYRPGGSTALHDAMATAIDGTDAYLDGHAGSERPENVVVVVLTDGRENASETPQEVVRERVEARQDDGWEFLFIGANQDAVLTAEGLGMGEDRALDMSHSGEGAQEAYRSTSRQISNARQTGQTGGYTEEDRRRQWEVDGE